MERFWTLQFVRQQGLREIEATVFKTLPGQPPMARADTLPLVLPVLGTGGIALARGSRVLLQLSEPDDISLDIQGQFIRLLDSDASASADTDDAGLEEEDNAGPLAIAVDMDAADADTSPGVGETPVSAA
jgi:exoribonuclease-2